MPAVPSSLESQGTRLSLALEAARLGDWSWDVATDLVTMSARAAEIFGIPPGPHMTWAADAQHPASRRRRAGARRGRRSTRLRRRLRHRISRDGERIAALGERAR